ncbi:MAG: beta strand repeat-containing protein [Cyanophyceae cyanobacterium]
MSIFTVNRADDVTADDGQLTLREAIALANATPAADEIQFDPAIFAGTQTITLGGSELQIDRDLTITGTGQNNLVIDGNNGSRVFLISNTNDANVTLTNLTIQRGRLPGTTFGAGIRNNSGGELTLNTVLITENIGTSGGSGIFIAPASTVTVTNSTISNGTGIGINNNGTLTLTNSTISGNRTPNASGGGIFSSGGSVLTIINSTISGNTSRYGGALSLRNGATITNSTITGNTATGVGGSGGGIRNQGTNFPMVAPASPVIISNSIIAGNVDSGGNTAPDVSGDVINSGGNNILGTSDGNGSGSIGSGTGDTVLANQMPAVPIGNVLNTTLANNGGPTPTHALVAGSLAIDNAGGGAEAQDQRGASIAGVRRDIGAFEFFSAQEINVLGNGVAIAAGDTTPDSGDGTDFGGVAETGGAIAKTFTVQNLGQTNLTLSGTPTISGTNAIDFTVTTAPNTAVGALNSTTFQITFDPTASGSRTATVNIGSDDADENPYTFAIQGQGISSPAEINVTGNSVAIADGDTTPDTADNTDFGTIVATGFATVAREFAIANQGESELSLLGTPLIALSGTDAGDFSVTTLPTAAIARNSSTPFGITFQPSTPGTKTAIVTIASNDADENPYTFTIQGEGEPVLPPLPAPPPLPPEAIAPLSPTAPTNTDTTSNDPGTNSTGNTTANGTTSAPPTQQQDGSSNNNALPRAFDVAPALGAQLPSNTPIWTAGDDTLKGADIDGDGKQWLNGSLGDDLIFGNLDQDVLTGGPGNDSIFGGKGDDWIKGAEGDDLLAGDFGDDTLIGGGGNDFFVIGAGRGSDEILDFTDGVDGFLLEPTVAFDQLTLAASDNSTQIKFGDEVLVTVIGVASSLIDASDFNSSL